MSAFAPDLSHYWLPEREEIDRADVLSADDEPAASAVLKEFEALVERVNAARSIF